MQGNRANGNKDGLKSNVYTGADASLSIGDIKSASSLFKGSDLADSRNHHFYFRQ